MARLSEVVYEAKAAGFDDKDIVEIVEKAVKMKTNPDGPVPQALMQYVNRKSRR